jgi:hypothetical protein
MVRYLGGLTKIVQERISHASKADANVHDFNKMRRVVGDCTIVRGSAQGMVSIQPSSPAAEDLELALARLDVELEEARAMLTRYEQQNGGDVTAPAIDPVEATRTWVDGQDQPQQQTQTPEEPDEQLEQLQEVTQQRQKARLFACSPVVAQFAIRDYGSP